MLTCKEFLAELSDFLDDETDACIKAKLQRHASECPDCWVICDTTRKTIQVYKGMESCTIPPDVHERLIAALDRKVAAQIADPPPKS